MATTNPTHATTVESHYDRLGDVLPVGIMLWKTLKAVTYALFFGIVGYVAVRNGADPDPVALAVIGASLAAFVGELREVEIAGLVTLTFAKRNKNDDGDDRGMLLLALPAIAEFASDHEEQHAIPAGTALGFAAVATGEFGVLAVVPALFQQVWERTKRPKPSEKQDLANDIRREPHYFFFGIVVGALLGIAARVAT